MVRPNDPQQIAHGLAKDRMPGECGDRNIIPIPSGRGDGVYPITDDVARDGAFLAVHIGCLVVGRDPGLNPG